MGRFLARYFASVLGIVAAVMGLAALGLFLAGARDVRQYGSVFVSLGLGAWALGALSVLGEWKITRSFSYTYSSSVSHAGSAKRVKQLTRDILGAYRFLIHCFLVGIILIGIGVWLYFR
jgi:hypothetical protein